MCLFFIHVTRLDPAAALQCPDDAASQYMLFPFPPPLVFFLAGLLTAIANKNVTEIQDKGIYAALWG